MANERLKAEAKKAGVPMWRIAEYLNFNEFSFSRKLRHEVSADEEAKILAAIKTISKSS